MTRSARDMKRLMDAYDLDTRRRVARYEGLTTRAARLDYRLLTLKYQFLPHYFSAVPAWRLRLRSLSGPRTFPDFACVGPIKAGTSDLATYMFQHPCILPPLAKEVTSRNPRDWLPYYPTVEEKERVAREHGKALSGHFNPALSSVPLMDGYHRVRPDGKVILMLRNPSDRAYSHYKWDLLAGGKALGRSPYYQTFTACVDFALAFFPGVPFPSPSAFDLLATGIYVKAVKMWMDRFGRENVHVLRAEDFFADVASSVCAIHVFLGLPPQEPELHPIVNQNPIKAPPFEKEARQKLQAFYRPWNEELYALLGRDMKWD
jgi:hypothetical protein